MFFMIVSGTKQVGDFIDETSLHISIPTQNEFFEIVLDDFLETILCSVSSLVDGNQEVSPKD